MRLQKLAAAILLMWVTAANGATLFGPTSYQSEWEVPDGFYTDCDGCTSVLETFEDNSLDYGITVTASNGQILNPNGAFQGFSDSVDKDDGTIDGMGNAGFSYFSPANTLTVEFPYPVDAAGVVWTDGDVSAATTFEAFGPDGSLGVIGPAHLADYSFMGTTADDHFFGVRDAGGITSLVLTNSGGAGIEIDHIQFEVCQDCVTSGTSVVNPEPSSIGLLGLGVLGLLSLRRRR